MGVIWLWWRLRGEDAVWVWDLEGEIWRVGMVEEFGRWGNFFSKF